MLSKTIVYAICAANLIVLPAMAEVYSTRNFGMGGAGVASSQYSDAPGSNGALLTRFGETDDVALNIPQLAVQASDKENVLDTLDDIPDLYDDLKSNIDSGNTPGALNNAENIIQKLEEISGDVVGDVAAALIGFAKPSKSLAIAFDVRSSLQAGVVDDYVSTDRAVLLRAIATGDIGVLDKTESSALGLGALVTEAVLTVAREFAIDDDNAVSLSISPKYQRVDTLIYAATVQDYDDNDLDENRNDDGNFNVDVGVSYALDEDWMFGLSGRNLISEDYDTKNLALGSESFQGTYQIKPAAVLGVAYGVESFTATLEGDLLKNRTFKGFDKTQFLRAGAEYSALGWIQLRVGYRYDIEDNYENIFTAGLGVSPWDVFHFDLSGSYGENDTYGLALGFLWTF